jgi:uncharacterized membrane protein
MSRQKENLKTENFKKKFFASSLHLMIALGLVILTPLILSNYYQSIVKKFRETDTVLQSRTDLKNSRAKVVQILKETQEKDIFSGNQIAYQTLKVKFLEGDLKNEIRELTFPLSINNKENERLKIGDTVIVTQRPIFNNLQNNQQSGTEKLEILPDQNFENELENENTESESNQNQELETITEPLPQEENNQNTQENLSIAGKYRLDTIFYLVLFFLIIIVLLAGVKGLTASLSVIFSLTVLIQFLIPQIIQGNNIIWTTFLVSTTIGLVSLFLSHGFSKRILISSLSMLITLILSTFFADFVVRFTSLTGLSSDEVFALQTSNISANINFQGLLLAGIIIGSIGVLDDVIVAQATAIEEISSANPLLTFRELVTRGFRIGKEHIISMVNSLAFAYAGSSLPILLLFVLYNTSNPLLTINQELISEEIVRTIVGSVTLFLAVPVTTLLASRFLKKTEKQR